ncbi:MAG: hypothetical protein BRD23_09230 [Halobacteriales archaeon SW_9_67_25]|jgi:hypothetical protein|nr:MAG: hypothetical protein BRD23_09230 [Halobacteriales archaeon SW_9_67_25]
MHGPDDPLARLRRPEHTGENRCLPCTVVNAAIALLLGAGVATAAVAGGLPVDRSLVLATGVLALCGVTIALRGYLFPGTPWLTRRYLPEWVLARFGKEPASPERAGNGAGDPAFDPEDELVAAGALEACPDRDDLCLTDGFREAWLAAIDRVREADADRAELLAALDVESGAISYEEFGDAFRARVDDRVAGRWESRAAFLADLGAARVLAERHPDWDGLGLRQRSQLLHGLRLFLDTCPACGARPEFGTETVESCCWSHEVAAVSCPGCGARLFESDPV